MHLDLLPAFAYLLLEGRLYFSSFSVMQGPRTCRGSILTKSMVLTAAHCLIKVDSDESVSTASAEDITVQHGKNCCLFSSICIIKVTNAIFHTKIINYKVG